MIYSRPASNSKINLDKQYRRFLASLLLQSAIELSVWWTGILCAALLAAYFSRGEFARVLLIFSTLSSAVAVVAIVHMHIKRKANVTLLCRALEKRQPRFRDLYSAWELSNAPPDPGVSEPLKERLFRDVQNVLDAADPERWAAGGAPRFYAQNLALLAALLAGLVFFPPYPGREGAKRLVWGDQREFEKFVKVDPKGGSVLSGSDAFIRAELLRETQPYPRLQVESGGRWQDIPAESQGPVSTFRIRSVLERVRYRVQWNDLIGGPYQLVPMEWPYLTDFRMRIIHPAYTGLPEETIEGEPQLNVLRGARIILTAAATKDLKSVEMVASNGIRYPVALEEGRTVRVEFTALNPFDFHFDLTDREGVRPDKPVSYRVMIREDRYPEIRLLAPSDDLSAGRESEIPFTFEIKDDMGASGVYLNARSASGSRKILLKRYKTPPVEKIDEAKLDLASLDAEPGTVLQLQLEVQDNDTVTGPKSGLSQTISVEIQSYEADHKKIEDALQGFRKDLLSVLADQTLNRKSDRDWKALEPNPAELEKQMKEAERRQIDQAAKTQSVENKLSEILEKMSEDPLTGYDIYAEHRAMRDALGSIRSGSMQRAQQQFGAGKWSEGAAEQDQTIAELERLADISEEVMKHNKMKDLVHSADRLEQKGRSLEESLAGAQSLDPKLARELRETLNEAMRILDEIQRQLQDMPQDLPEDFVNQAAMKNLDMNQMAESADALNRALQNSDLKSALAAAKDLLSRVKSARDAISNSAEDTPLSGKGDMAAAMEQKSDALDQLVERQENLLRKTLKMEAKRKEAAMEAQRKMLQDLAKRQKALIERARALAGDVEKSPAEPGLKSHVQGVLSAAEPKMHGVLRELESGNVIFAQKWLKEIIDHMAGGEVPVEAFLVSRSSVGSGGGQAAASAAAWKSILGQSISVRTEEQEILNRLKDNTGLSSQKFSDQDKSELSAMAQEQKQIADQNRKLRSDISQLAGQSAQIKPEIMESMRSAGGEMEAAEGALKSASTPEAAGSQERALAHLRKGRESLQNAQAEHKKIRQSAGSKPQMIQPRNQPGGQQGSRAGSVRIPGAEDYLPPKEFREEILESLKEKYPQAQEETIKQYFKKITQ